MSGLIDPEMEAVITLREACQIWKKDPSNTLRDLYKMRIRIRRSAGVWLVSRRDCERRWGKPKPADMTYSHRG